MEQFRSLPSVDRLLNHPRLKPLFELYPHSLVAEIVRHRLEEVRRAVDEVFSGGGLSTLSIRNLATIDIKRGERGILGTLALSAARLSSSAPWSLIKGSRARGGRLLSSKGPVPAVSPSRRP